MTMGRAGRRGAWAAPVATLAAALALAACTTDGTGTVGSAGGVATTSSIAPAAGPALAGLDPAGQQLARGAETAALNQTGKPAPVAWSDPANPSSHGSVVAGPISTASGGACRPFTHTIYANGVPRTQRGQACRGPDGSWRDTA